MKVFILSLCIIGVAQAWLFGKKAFPPWNKLSVTFLKYSGLPMSEDAAKDDGWILSKDGCQDASGLFFGKRYVKNGDMTTMLLFDSHGQIAGMQFGFTYNKDLAKNKFVGGPIIADGANYQVTAYFTDPKSICIGAQRSKYYVGEKLLIDMGKGKFMEIPLKEEGIKSTSFVKGKCFVGMGQHYWYNVSKDMDCNNYFPLYLLYNEYILNGFGFAFQIDSKSDRVEHPPKNLLWLFFQEETRPKCLQNVKVLTTQHVYLQRRPYWNFC